MLLKPQSQATARTLNNGLIIYILTISQSNPDSEPPQQAAPPLLSMTFPIQCDQ